MSRRHRAEKRVVAPDAKHGSEILTKFINKVMGGGKKSLAETIVYGSFDKIQNKFKVDPFQVFTDALRNVKPNLEVTSVRVGGANYQVPSVITDERSYTLATRWVIDSAKKRSELTMIDKLAGEIFDASNNKGGAVKKKEDTHRMAEANKAFAHLSPKKVS